MKRYLIKVTYLEGAHIGHSYLLTKGGYVTTANSIQWEDTTYKTFGLAFRRCQQLKRDNERNIRCEKADREYAIKKGRRFRNFNIYEAESYEPYEVEV